MHTIKIFLAVTMALSLSVFAFSLSALAAKPANQACLGHDLSNYARNGSSEGLVQFEAGRGFGQTVAWQAGNSPMGLGDNTLAWLAGELPDFVIPNTCND